MQLPFVTTPTLAAVGYTDAKMTASWKTIIDAFNAAFPNHCLSNDFHPVNGSNAVADSVYAYAVSAIGNRYGANAWWWTQHNTSVYASQYSILQNSAVNNNFTGVQMAYSGTNDSASFGAGGMPAALQLAINDGVCYLEFWNNDILNPAFDSLLTYATCQQTTAIERRIGEEFDFTIYPNPVQNKIIIELPQRNFSVQIFDVAGHKILERKIFTGMQKLIAVVFRKEFILSNSTMRSHE